MIDTFEKITEADIDERFKYYDRRGNSIFNNIFTRRDKIHASPDEPYNREKDIDSQLFGIYSYLILLDEQNRDIIRQNQAILEKLKAE